MRPAKPQLTRDSARLAVGLRSNSSNPKLRTSETPGSVAAEELHEPVGETGDAAPIAKTNRTKAAAGTAAWRSSSRGWRRRRTP